MYGAVIHSTWSGISLSRSCTKMMSSLYIAPMEEIRHREHWDKEEDFSMRTRGNDPRAPKVIQFLISNANPLKHAFAMLSLEL